MVKIPLSSFETFESPLNIAGGILPQSLPHPPSMSFFDLFRTKTPAEQIRENKRMIDRSIRELDRDRTKMEAQEKKTVAEMKKLAKAGQKVGRRMSQIQIQFQIIIFFRTRAKYWQKMWSEVGRE